MIGLPSSRRPYAKTLILLVPTRSRQNTPLLVYLPGVQVLARSGLESSRGRDTLSPVPVLGRGPCRWRYTPGLDSRPERHCVSFRGLSCSNIGDFREGLGRCRHGAGCLVCSPSLARAHRHVPMAASWEEDPCMSVHGRVSRGRTVRRACQGGNPGTRIERELRTFSLHCSPFHFCISVSLPCSPFSCSLGSPLLSQYTPATGIPSSSRCGRHRVQSDADRILCCAGILAGGLDSVPRGKEVPISVGSGTSCGSGGVQESLLRFMITSCSSFGTLTTAQTSSV